MAQVKSARLRGKKAILLTLGITFISLTILAFANILLKNSENSEERVKELLAFERVQQIDASIARTLTKFLNGSEGNAFAFSSGYKNFTLTTRFFNETFGNETYVRDHFTIFGNQTRYYHNISFSEGFISDSGIFSLPEIVDTQTLYLEHNPNMSLEFGLFPHNFVYLNGFNATTTAEVNITLKSKFEAVVINEVSSPCTQSDCVDIFIDLLGEDPGQQGGQSSSVHHASSYDVDTPNSVRELFNITVRDNSRTKNYSITVVGYNAHNAPQIPNTRGLLISNTHRTENPQPLSFAEFYELEKGSNETLVVDIHVILQDNHPQKVGFVSKGIVVTELPFFDIKSSYSSIAYVLSQ